MLMSQLATLLAREYPVPGHICISLANITENGSGQELQLRFVLGPWEAVAGPSNYQGGSVRAINGL